jgi:hypothetical protein
VIFVTYFNGWLNLYVTREKPCIQAKKWRVMFVCVNMASENEESHMVMQTLRFDLDAKDEVSSFQPPTKVPRKENNHGFL